MLTSKSRWLALAALALTTLAVGLDTTVLSVALPTLARDLHASTGDLQWFTSGYLLVLAAALLPAGVLGDRFGRKRMLITALVIFGAASVACSYAQNTASLIAARAVLGLGAAVIIPLSGAVVGVLFDEKTRPRAIGIWLTASALGIPLGPLLGGWLLDHFWWGSVFLINGPVVLIGILALTFWMPESHGERSGRIDFLGIVLSAAGLVGLTYGVISAGSRGWTDARSLLSLAAGVVLLCAFVLVQRRLAHPLVDLALFRSRAFTGGAVLATIASFAMLGLLFSLPQYFSAVGGHDAFGSGLRLLPVIAGLVVGARIGEKLVSRFGARIVIGSGLGLLALASFACAFTGTGTSYAYVAACISVTGLSLGLVLPPSMDAAMSALSPARGGVGNAVLQAMRQVGGAVGTAVLGAVLNAGYRSHLPSSVPAVAHASVSAGVAVTTGDNLAAVRTAFVHGMDQSLVVGGAVALIGVVLAVFLLPDRPVAAPVLEQEEVMLAESGI